MVAKVKAVSGSPREKGTLGAMFTLAAEGQLRVLQVSMPRQLGTAEAP